MADALRKGAGWGRRGTTGAAIAAELGFDGVGVHFGSRQVLQDVSFTVGAGEIVCLLGASGCGKTTLLRLAAGVDRPTSGVIRLDNRIVAGQGAFVEPEDRGIGLVFQDYALFPHLSVLDNVRFGLRAMGFAEAEITARRALDRVGLAALVDAFPHQLSGGEQQRVALARAIAPRPGVLLMDEPFSNLDRRLRDEVRDETMAVVREMRATAILVTHDPEDAMRVADRIVLMRKGRIEQIGTADQLYRHPVSLYAARFFCDFNEIEGVVRNGGAHTPLGRFKAPGLAEGAHVLVLIRPSSLKLAPAGFCLPGRVQARRFLGDSDLLQVAMPGLERPVSLRQAIGESRGKASAQAGQDVGIDIIADEVLVFAADAT
jgi:iron(III) transport system ATP-binding protein